MAGSANPRRIILGSVLIIACAAIALWLYFRAADTPPKHVLILSIESVRWDHLGIAGYSRPTSPYIDMLAARGTCFNRAYAQASWTRPSIASTFTSTYPSTHQAANDRRARALAGVPEDAPKTEKDRIAAGLMPPFTTLAEVFTSRGYRCFGWSCNVNVSEDMGFGQGFEHYDGRGRWIWDRANEMLRERGLGPATPTDIPDICGVSDEGIVTRLAEIFGEKDRAPTMVFVHLMKPHLPYLPQSEYHIFETVSEGIAITQDNQNQIKDGEIPLTDRDIAFNVDLYDGTIRETDERIGRILNALNKSELGDETLVIFAADHGEEFHDHDKVGHGHSAYEELIHVPLIFAGPGIPAGKTVEEPVELIDILPTLASILWEEELPFAQGRDLTPLLRGKARAKAGRLVFAESGTPGNYCAVIDGTWKLIVYEEKGEIELFDLENDPLEKANLASEPAQVERVRRLSEAVQTYSLANAREHSRYDPGIGVPLSDEAIEQLRSLGYIK